MCRNTGHHEGTLRPTEDAGVFFSSSKRRGETSRQVSLRGAAAVLRREAPHCLLRDSESGVHRVHPPHLPTPRFLRGTRRLGSLCLFFVKNARDAQARRLVSLSLSLSLSLSGGGCRVVRLLAREREGKKGPVSCLSGVDRRSSSAGDNKWRTDPHFRGDTPNLPKPASNFQM